MFTRVHVPKLQEIIIKEEIKRLENIRVLDWANESDWGAPSFAHPKKNGKENFFQALEV